MEGGWTLGAHIDRYQSDRDSDHRLREADRALFMAEIRHVHEMAALRQVMYDLHFKGLNENAARTIEERGHFVTKEAYDPTLKAILEYMATHKGQQSGISSTVTWTIAIIGAVVGVAGVIVAVVSLLYGS